MYRWSFVVTTLVVLAASGCGGGDPCGRTSPCKNDPAITQADRDQCRALFTANQSAACYGEFVAYANCAADNIVCGGDGKTDSSLSRTKAENSCTNQRANIAACCIKNSSSSLCK